MSQLSTGQPPRDKPINGDTSNEPNTLDGKSEQTSSAMGPDFGRFHDRVQDDVGQLESALHTANDTLFKLAKTFRQHGEMIQIVDERWGKDQELEKEIQRLKAGNEELWRLRQEDLRKASRLEEEAEAGEKEKLRYQGLGIHLKDDYTRREQKMKQKYEETALQVQREFEQKKAKLETGNAEKIAALQEQKEQLRDANTQLKQNLDGKTKELEMEKESDKRLQESLWKEIGSLKGKVDDMEAKYAVKEHPLKYYVDRYEEVTHTVGQISTSYFADLPERARDDPASTFEQLKKRSTIFLRTPILESECSQILRMANVQHIIFDIICDRIWQPFFSEYLLKYDGARLALQEIYVRLAADGDQVQRKWKVSALRMLDRLDGTSDSLPLVESLTAEVIDILRPLLDDRHVIRLQTDLRQLFTRSIELGKIAERDRSPIQISREPSLDDSNGWKEYCQDLSEVSGINLPSPPMGSQHPLYVTPKIYRPATNETQEFLVLTGSALFPHTGIFQQGLAEWEHIKNAYRAAAKSFGKSRKTSTSSAVMVSPTWPGAGLGLNGQ